MKRGTIPATTSETVLGALANPAISVSLPVHVPARENAIVNRLTKTKVEKEVDHEAERQVRLKAEGRVKKAAAIEQVRPACSTCPILPEKGAQRDLVLFR